MYLWEQENISTSLTYPSPDHHTNFVCGRGDGDKAYPCPECPAKLGSPRDVRRHMATHGPRQEWKCPNCPTILR